MADIDLSKFTREEAIAYIEALQKQNQEQAAKIKEQQLQLQKMQALNEMLAKARKKMFGQSSEQVQYLQGEQQSFFNEAEKDYDGGAKEPTEETLVQAHTRKPKRRLLFLRLQGPPLRGAHTEQHRLPSSSPESDFIIEHAAKKAACLFFIRL